MVRIKRKKWSILLDNLQKGGLFRWNYTLDKVRSELTAMGYESKDCGRAGIVALAGGKKPGKTILLRVDMDALPLQEMTGLDFASQTPGKMHGCGHTCSMWQSERIFRLVL